VDPTAEEQEAERQKEKEEAQKQALAQIEREVARKRWEAEKEAKTMAKEAEKVAKEAEKAEKAAREREKKVAQQLAQKEAKAKAKAKAPKSKDVKAEPSEKPLKSASKPTVISPVVCSLCQASNLECRVLRSGPHRSCQICKERKKKCSLVLPPIVSHDLSNPLLEKAQHQALKRILRDAQQAGTLEARDNAGQSDMGASDIGKSLNLISSIIKSYYLQIFLMRN
jgi:multidrug efflux pump subunit AcrA (membrane-fusion protein)